MTDSVQDQIFKIIFTNPGINQNGIWRKAKNIHAKPVFEKNLKLLVKNKTLLKKKDPTHSQRKLFFVNSDKAETLNDLNTRLELMDQVFDDNQSLVYDFLKKHYSGNTTLTKGIIDVFYILVNDIVNITNASLVYNLMGNEMFYRKSEQIRTKHVKKLQKSLKILKQKNYFVFKDLMAFVVYKLEIPY